MNFRFTSVIEMSPPLWIVALTVRSCPTVTVVGGVDAISNVTSPVSWGCTGSGGGAA